MKDNFGKGENAFLQEIGKHVTLVGTTVDGTLERPDMRSHAGAWERVNRAGHLVYLVITLRRGNE